MIFCTECKTRISIRGKSANNAKNGCCIHFSARYAKQLYNSQKNLHKAQKISSNIYLFCSVFRTMDVNKKYLHECRQYLNFLGLFWSKCWQKCMQRSIIIGTLQNILGVPSISFAPYGGAVHNFPVPCMRSMYIRDHFQFYTRRRYLLTNFPSSSTVFYNPSWM